MEMKTSSHKGWFTRTSNANANALTRVNYHNANANACAKRKRQRKEWKIFHFLALVFAFHTCEPEQSKGKRKRKCKMKNTRSMPLWFKLKPRWRPFLISFPESSFLDCWSKVTQTLGIRLPPSWDTAMRVCDRHLNVAFACVCVDTCEAALRKA